MYSQIAEQEEERLRILKLREEFSTTNIQMMADKREMMNRQEHIWALFSFNNVENKNGCNGGVYEILESHDIIYISGLPRGVHIRDALNAHFSGNDGLVLGKYLSTQGGDLRKFSVRFMLSDQPREDARQLLRYYQLSSKGAVPKFN
uniref:Uncharacterized protein n=1 Tax=Clytia hemisphaerica TaxID=252671 RepID=A0A7M5XAL2_9CNID